MIKNYNNLGKHGQLGHGDFESKNVPCMVEGFLEENYPRSILKFCNGASFSMDLISLLLLPFLYFYYYIYSRNILFWYFLPTLTFNY